ncbi:MAG: MFS transporter [Propionibacteriaceae bacterium]|nr:MFS transporter [Propionibacteriaceae bacterium]
MTAERQPMFASLRVRNYRLFAAGALVSNIGGWMAMVAQDWLVLTELTSGSASALGLVAGLQFLPVALCAPLAGAFADRFDKRRVLLVTQSAAAASTIVLFTLVVTGAVRLWHVFILAGAFGTILSFDNPARQAFVSEMVSPELLPNAIGLNSASFNAARLVGPGVAGVLIGAFGIAPVLAINALTYAAVIGALLAMRTADLDRTPVAPRERAVRDGLAYVGRRPDILLVMFIVFMLGTFGLNFPITNALMATQIFGKGAEAYGLLGSVMAIGSLAAALLAARRTKPRLRVLLGSLAGFSGFSALLAFAPSYPVYAALLVPVGLTAMTVLPSANSMVQLSTEPEYRGRVMAVYMAIFLGGTPIGAPLIGWIGDAWGARWTLLAGSIATALTCLIAGGYLLVHERHRHRLRPISPRWLRERIRTRIELRDGSRNAAEESLPAELDTGRP